MIKFDQFALVSLLAFAPVVAVSAEQALPDWLQGRASDLAPPPPQLSAAEILSLCKRPHNFPQLLESLKLVWGKKLLIQRDFYRDDNLKCFFDGATIVWHQKPTIPIPKDANFRATITADPHEFPGMLIDVGIVINFEKAVSVLPDRESYSGMVRVEMGTSQNLAWREVKRVFGPETMTRSTYPLGNHTVNKRSPGKAFAMYLYPGDRADKYGLMELPQVRFLLQQGPTAVDLQHRLDTPLDDDTVSSILVIERTNIGVTGK
jgi:hypothetical protein